MVEQRTLNELYFSKKNISLKRFQSKTGKKGLRQKKSGISLEMTYLHFTAKIFTIHRLDPEERILNH